MIVVTGGAGFIGSNLIERLNQLGRSDILVVDNMTRPEKCRNLADLTIADYEHKTDFHELLCRRRFDRRVEVVYHQGACSDTMESDGRYMMHNNYTFSRDLCHWCLERHVPFVYASSAATYGNSRHCSEQPGAETPLNVYGYSKLAFDQHVRSLMPAARSTLVGLRYFNVYGPREAHKGRMASMIWQLYRQLAQTGVAKLFCGTDGIADGEQERDFVYVRDVVNVNLHFGQAEPRQCIVNVGTGVSRSFNDIASTLIHLLGTGRIEYIPFPDSLLGKYQNYTCAEIDGLRSTGYDLPFETLENGIKDYLCRIGTL